MKMQGIFPAIATPFDNESQIYKIKVRHNVERWNRTALSGYVVCGSTGEIPLLEHPERMLMLQLVAEHAAPDKILITGIIGESVYEVVRSAGFATDTGYKAALVLPPRYYRSMFSKPESQLLFFRAVADQSRIPILLYHFPQVSGIDMTPDTVAALAEHPNIIGMKDSSGNLEGTKAFIKAAPKDFQVLTGSSNVLADSLATGCSGSILALANAVPYACISIWEAHRTREAEAAQDWQQRIRPASSLISGSYGIPGLKHAMDLMGYFGGPPRLPLVPVGPAAQAEIAQAFLGLKG